MRGEEIASGAQRLHDAELLKQCCSKRGIDVQQLRSYIKALELGAPPHAGMGAGLERIVMLYYGLSPFAAAAAVVAAVVVVVAAAAAAAAVVAAVVVFAAATVVSAGAAAT